MDVKDVVEKDKDAIILYVVNSRLNEILYKRPVEWFDYLEGTVKLGCPSADEIERIAEAKATRDLLVHNRGVATPTYRAKAGRFARWEESERVDITEDYHRATWELLRKIVNDVCAAAVSKAR